MAVTTTLFPGTATGAQLMATRWTNTLEDAVYDELVFASNVRDVGAPWNSLKIRKVARQAYSTLDQSTGDGSGLTYAGLGDTAVTLTGPTGIYLAAAFSENLIAQLDLSADGPFRQNCESGMAESIDTICLSDVSTFTQNGTSSYANPLDGSTLRNGVSVLRTTARSKAEPGKADIHFVVDSTRWQDLPGVPEISHAHILGVQNGPSRTGLFVEALGCTLHFSASVNKSGAGADNPLFVPSAYGIGYNQRPMVRIETVELNHRIICYANFAHGIIHDVRGMNIKSTKVL
jgi:hypothetical protein